MYYVYILKSRKDQRLYIGYTKDLHKRLERHNSRTGPSTKHRAPFELVYYEAYKSPRDAHKREAMLKLYKKAYAQLKRRIGDSLKT